jgi:hypothetical protein
MRGVRRNARVRGYIAARAQLARPHVFVADAVGAESISRIASEVLPALD